MSLKIHDQILNHCSKIGDFIVLVFTALHVMQTWYCENSVCPSVCHTRDPWQNGRKICLDFYTIRKNNYS